MRSRTLREGSVGLLIILGLGLLGGSLLWLKGFALGEKTYSITVEFDNVAGLQPGAPVRFRGVSVGRVLAVRPGSGFVEADIEFFSNELLIPRDVFVEANQVGLVGETSVDIYPEVEEVAIALSGDPLTPDCDSSVILCDGARLPGTVGVSYDTLIRGIDDIAELFTETGFFDEVRELTRNSSDAAASVAELSREVASLTRTVEPEVGKLAEAAVQTTEAFGNAATQISLTAAQVNELIEVNRSALISTLNNIDQASSDVQNLLSSVSPALEDGTFLANLETLSTNAAIASENLRVLSETVGSPENLLMLQQTLDSARVTFQNAQKITADLDELTGDPEFRRNVRDLIDGLSSLVSSAEQLQQQTQIAQALAPIQETSASRPDAFDEIVQASIAQLPQTIVPYPNHDQLRLLESDVKINSSQFEMPSANPGYIAPDPSSSK
ncbi:MAG: MCE family protein [Synechococcales cyanobacterium T60_A2020_003]|nr:MCE family protein [Synechococcales cyanobacterium T60_A2020_003]